MEEKGVRAKLLFLYICLICGTLGMEAGGLQYNLLLISEEMGLTSTQMGNIVSVQYLALFLAFCGIGGVLSPTIFGFLADRVSIQASLLFVFGITATGFVISVIYNILVKKLVINSN